MSSTLICLLIASAVPLASAPLPPPCVARPVRSEVVFRATGVGHPPARMKGAQRRLMARRAAEVVAVRNLGKELGLGPNVRVRGFKYVSVRYLPGEAVEVTVEAVRSAAAKDGHPRQSPARRAGQR